MVHDYREIKGADEVTIKHMLKQFSLIYEAYQSPNTELEVYFPKFSLKFKLVK